MMEVKIEAEKVKSGPRLVTVIGAKIEKRKKKVNTRRRYQYDNFILSKKKVSDNLVILLGPKGVYFHQRFTLFTKFHPLFFLKSKYLLNLLILKIQPVFN